MSLERRISKMEGVVQERELWERVERLAQEMGRPLEEVLEGLRMARSYLNLYSIPHSEGKVDIEPALRRMAEKLGLDPDEVVHEAERLLE